MSLPIIVIVLFAAFLHATWNFLVKHNHDKTISMSAVVMGHAPFAIIVLMISPTPNLESLPYLLTGVLLHVGYHLFLLASYRVGDLTQVYPLARGVAPLLVTGVSIVFLGVSLSKFELIGIAMIGLGIMSLTLTRSSLGLRNSRAAMLALITGGFIASYSIVDGLGARAAGTALGYFGWLSVLNATVFAGIMQIKRPGVLTNVIKQNWKLTLCGGGASFLAYALVIWAFTLAPIALVTALRETSIIFALLLGVWFLKEPLSLNKLLATFLTLVGASFLRIKA